MNTRNFTIKREYEICCKLFFPEEGNIRHIIIGVHGFAGDKNSSMLKKLAEDVCQKGAALLCFDFPAHGESPVGEEMLTVENCKSDLCSVVEYVIRNYPDAGKTIFATSFGGFVTLLCAEQLANFHLVLRAPAVTMPKVLLDNVLQISAEDFEQRECVTCGFERPIRLPYSFYRELTQQEDLFRKKIASPALIIHGDRDDIVPPEDVQRFVAAQKGIRLVLMGGADHRFKNPGEIETIIEWTTHFIGL